MIAYYIRGYRLLTIAESFRSSLTSTIVELVERFRSRFAARFSSARLESGLVFVVRPRARISLNSISFYRRSASEISADPRFALRATSTYLYTFSPFVYPCVGISQVWLATGCVNACGSRSRRCVRRDCGQCINPARM